MRVKEGMVNSGFRRNRNQGKTIGFEDGYGYHSWGPLPAGHWKMGIHRRCVCKAYGLSPYVISSPLSERGMETEEARFSVDFGVL